MASKDRHPLIYGIKCDADEPMIGAPLHRDGRNAGLVTARAWSPYHEYGIGYARMAARNDWDGETVPMIGVEGQAHSAAFLTLPYYDADKSIARGVDTELP